MTAQQALSVLGTPPHTAVVRTSTLPMNTIFTVRTTETFVTVLASPQATESIADTGIAEQDDGFVDKPTVSQESG